MAELNDEELLLRLKGRAYLAATVSVFLTVVFSHARDFIGSIA